jgi:hypothetical protein
VSGTEIRALSQRLGEVQPRLAALRDEVERGLPVDLGDRARSILDSLSTARDALDSLGEAELADPDDAAVVVGAVACARAAIELGPACRALSDVPGAIADRPLAVRPRVLALLLAIAHRQCVAAMHALERSHP